MQEKRIEKIAIAVLGYNSAHDLPTVFDSLLASDCRDAALYYIDNASQDDSVALIRARYGDRVTVVRNAQNTGYAGAYADFLAEIFAQATYDAVILINPDVVVSREWFVHLVHEAFVDDMIALAQPQILQLDAHGAQTAQISACGGDLHYFGFGILQRKRSNDVDVTTSTGFVSGTCMLIKREAYMRSGALDRTYFMYMEDVDLSWRMRLCGYRCCVVHKSVIWHHYIFDRKKEQNRKKFYYLEKNRHATIIKNYTKRTILLLLPGLVVLEACVCVHALIHGYFVEKWRAWKDLCKNLSQLRKEHAVVQSKRIVSDRVIFDVMICRVVFAELEGPLLRMANVFFCVYYKLVRPFII